MILEKSNQKSFCASFTLFHFITRGHILPPPRPAKIATPCPPSQRYIYVSPFTTASVIFRFQTHSNSNERIENVKKHCSARKKRRKIRRKNAALRRANQARQAHIHNRKTEEEEEEEEVEE
jgi:hypothetical protein